MIKILWVDDEIEYLKPHILFLEQKGYQVVTATNGQDAIDLFGQENFDIVFLDENMPGISGLETLSELKEHKSTIPVIMITKSEEEYIMDEAIGSKIADYLIKPVNPNQILLSLKKNLDVNRLVSQKTTLDYQKEFRNIALELMQINTHEQWAELYKKLVFWELELENTADSGLMQILEDQKQQANTEFGKFIEKEYKYWINNPEDAPIFSHQIFRKWVIPELKSEEKVLFVVIDNLRYDQWKTFESTINEYYKIEKDSYYYSILPTATQYARNAIFSGMTPLEMEKKHPEYWKNDTDDGGKNLFESQFLEAQIQRMRLDIKNKYIKITNLRDGIKVAENFKSYKDNKLIALVYNFVDMISHAKTEMEVIKELASNDKAYRSLTLSWFKNSPLLAIIQEARKEGFKLIITTDHGTINCKNPSKVIGDRNTSLNLRYKTGKSLTYQNKDVYAVKNPNEIQLPSINLSSSFIFAKSDYFLAYQNNYNHYVNYFRNTYQHGGISLEEMIIPFVVLNPR
ncbi:T9SS response regulator signal transducer PorX [Avrilella dinanensis]|uniref:Two-component system response regulator n=1 Tax=Avrilella dinanensis TaxID=2008672 RepID=A0A2M9R5P8_9FLAO|nr:bifunctional response regulator/alkaline phosphatase family protein [Avrilella dinanensis]PJR04171.1 two-component system response regulator [Avrilella dinanensis]